MDCVPSDFPLREGTQMRNTEEILAWDCAGAHPLDMSILSEADMRVVGEDAVLVRERGYIRSGRTT